MTIIDMYTADIDPDNVSRLLAVRGDAISGLRARGAGLRRAELVRLDERRWLDLLVWDDAAAATEAAVHFGEVPALREMHRLSGDPTAHTRGTIEHAA